jgi:hypothetical protein
MVLRIQDALSTMLWQLVMVFGLRLAQLLAK